MNETKKKKGHKALVAVLIVVVIIVAGGLVYVNSLNNAYDAGDTETVVSVEIPAGSGTAAIGNILEENNVISSAFKFRMKSKIDGNDGQYKTGTYELSPSMTVEEIMNILMEGKQAGSAVTIPEGYNLKQISEVLEKNDICTAAEFMDEAANGEFDYDFMDQLMSGEQRLEGFLYPDTYEMVENQGAHSAIDTMLKRFDEIYTAAAENASAEVTENYNIFQIVTIASLIEREAKLDSERPLVASVIYNRLNDGMKLQFCSTVQYALGEVKARLYNSDLKIDSPYNTYLYEGLPVGPIASPGKASIEAALNPAETDYLFFVVSSAGDGSHNFAATGSEFDSYRDEYLQSFAE